MKMNEIIKYKSVDGAEITLTQEAVQQYLTNGQQVSEGEFILFAKLCQARGLNPFLKECYLIKMGASSPAQIVVSKDVILKRAGSHPQYAGKKSGIVVIGNDGDLQQREGICKLPSETLVGGWCEVYRKDREYKEFVSVPLEEYNNGKALWKTKPAFMINKVAVSRALRDAFPEELSGLYEKEEFGDYDTSFDLPAVETPTPIAPDIAPEEAISLTLEELSNGKLKKHNNATIQEVYQRDAQYLIWIANNFDAEVVRKVVGLALGYLDKNKATTPSEIIAPTGEVIEVQSRDIYVTNKDIQELYKLVPLKGYTIDKLENSVLARFGKNVKHLTLEEYKFVYQGYEQLADKGIPKNT
ncbi:MAG: phage recombination protein Bet [Epulopiscium sp. Nele67-Bin005]|nr:MAG: phage recombination protein Bet [Epulopiscium sp. Nele67-Bin005]